MRRCCTALAANLASSDGAVQDVLDPSTGDRITSVAIGGAAEVEMAFARPRLRFRRGAENHQSNARHSAPSRDEMEKHSKDLIQIESLDVGKAIVNSEGFDIPLEWLCALLCDLVQRVPMDTLLPCRTWTPVPIVRPTASAASSSMEFSFDL